MLSVYIHVSRVRAAKRTVVSIEAPGARVELAGRARLGGDGDDWMAGIIAVTREKICRVENLPCLYLSCCVSFLKNKV